MLRFYPVCLLMMWTQHWNLSVILPTHLNMALSLNQWHSVLAIKSLWSVDIRQPTQRLTVFRHTHTTYIDREEWDCGRCLVLPTWVCLCKWLLCNLVLICHSWMSDVLWMWYFYNLLFEVLFVFMWTRTSRSWSVDGLISGRSITIVQKSLRRLNLC